MTGENELPQKTRATEYKTITDDVSAAREKAVADAIYDGIKKVITSTVCAQIKQAIEEVVQVVLGGKELPQLKVLGLNAIRFLFGHDLYHRQQ